MGAEPDLQVAVWRSRLAMELLLVLLLVAGAMFWFVAGYLEPKLAGAFVARCDELVASTSDAMEALADQQVQGSRDLLVDVIRHTTDARSRTLADLPLGIYGGDVERIRTAIRAQDAERGARMQRNTVVLGAEMQRRAGERIDAHVAAIAAEQLARNEEFATEMRASHLWFGGGFLGLLVLVLGLGLYQFVVRPVGRLRAATQRVASGDLEVEVASHARDEIGALAGDFSTMVRQLRESRAELTRLNRELEQEVERKTRQLVHAEKIASIGTLAGGVAHEFNNLIGGIHGCTVEVLQSEQDPERRETLEVILRAAERARGITQQLLRFARRSVDKKQPTQLADVLQEALALVEPQARRRRVEIVRSIAPAPSIQADPDALHLVFVNLFTNGLQAMPDGGTLQIELTADRPARELLVRVRDQGIGIPAEDLDRVFEPFFTRKDRAKDPSDRGTGLGLSVSYGIVAAHGGRITVTSRPGEGSEFTVRLPLEA